MSEEIVLNINSLSKRFKIYHGQKGRIREWMTFGRKSYHKDFWAVKNISFEIARGEFVGIIGPNGAGKSTLLKIITGVLDSTSGSINATGKILSLLELTGGMDDDLTGPENISRTAQLLGFPDKYVNERMKQIEEFADLGEFFYRPLHTYSNGMRARLAFSLFAFMECDILILDEVFAVGDIFFKQKCFARLEELIKKKTSIVLVTHSTGMVRRYCNKVLVLDNGQLIYQGDITNGIQKYFQLQANKDLKLDPESTYAFDDEFETLPHFQSESNNLIKDWPEDIKITSEEHETSFAKLTHFSVYNEKGELRQSFRQGEKAYFYVEYLIKKNIGVPIASIEITTVKNITIHSKDSLQHNLDIPMKIKAGSKVRHRQVIKLDIAPGRYIINANLFALHPGDYKQIDTFSKKERKEKMIKIIRVKPGIVVEIFPLFEKSSREPHGGICNLTGDASIQLIDK